MTEIPNFTLNNGVKIPSSVSVSTRLSRVVR